MLVRDALFASSVPNYQTGPSPALGAIPHLYFMDPIEGRDRSGIRITPDFGVDITAQFETKARMLAAHASQRNWVLKQHGIDDYMLSMKKWAAKRGNMFGVTYAEGFRQYTGTPYPRTKLLQDLLGAALLLP
jgi:LmbE family N-acetylglucosaminyl deacetylase